MHQVVKYTDMASPEKPSKIDRFLKAGVYLNFITVPIAIALGRLDLALLDIGSGVVIEGARKKIKEIRGRFRLGGSQRLAVAGG